MTEPVYADVAGTNRSRFLRSSAARKHPAEKPAVKEMIAAHRAAKIFRYLNSATLTRQVAADAPQRNCISLRPVHIGRPNMTRPAEKHFSLIEEKLTSDYAGMFREPGGALKHPFLHPAATSMQTFSGIGIPG